MRLHGVTLYHNVIIPGISTVDTLDKADQCVSSPCKNAGLCVDGDYKYTCRCIPGYRGVNCEIPPSPAGRYTWPMISANVMFLSFHCKNK